MMLGLLLARAGVDVLVLEKHADFLRDFRGDTIHPSTLEVMHELGMLDEFLKLPHQEAREISAQVGGERVPVADFTHLPTRCKFVALMPQWDFLDFLAARAARYPSFRLWMRAEVVGLVEESGRVVGVEVMTAEGRTHVRADLVVGADGRHSVVRERAGLEVRELGAPMDVLWFRLSRRPEDPANLMGIFGSGRILVLINRGSYWQCGYVIAKGTIDEIRRLGLEAFRESVARIVPYARDRVAELRDWKDVSPLTVRVDDLARVQRRRELPTRVTQWLQVQVQKRVIAPVLGGAAPARLSLPVRLLRRFAILRRVPARLIGIGVRPEHVKSAVAPGRVDRPVSL